MKSYDSRCENEYCNYIMSDGRYCSNLAKVYNEETKLCVCLIHSNKCRRDYKKYKSICNVIWDKKCLHNTRDKDIKQYIDFAERCRDGRIEFTGQCSDSGLDAGHYFAVKKMNNIIDKCQKELDVREKIKKNIQKMFLNNKK